MSLLTNAPSKVPFPMPILFPMLLIFELVGQNAETKQMLLVESVIVDWKVLN